MRALLAFLFCVAASLAAPAAEPYPSRAIRLLVPFPPAGISDLSARLVAEGLRAKLNQPVIVENKPGANGVIGLRELLKADPDGYTVMIGNVGSVVINYADFTGRPACRTTSERSSVRPSSTSSSSPTSRTSFVRSGSSRPHWT
jgi:tripartite-type tricarboxylate transporter receptor subunit TctC